MSTPAICAPCTEDFTDNYVIRTGDLYVCGPDGITRSLGNIKVIDFVNTPNNVEHRSGKTGAVDAVLPLAEDFSLVATIDEITPQNLAYILGQDLAQTADGCVIPLTKRNCGRIYSAQFVHSFACADKTITIDIWRALITSEVKLTFGETPAEVPITIRALSCASEHPDSEYGQITFSEACPLT